MKKFRTAALLLALCLTFALPASAETGTPFSDVPVDAPYATAVTTLHYYGIIEGDDNGNFNPNATISRSEFSAILCRLMGAETAASQLRLSVFTDVPSTHWASGYVAWASQQGLLNGYGNGCFGPSDPVTVEQAAKMLVCAWGYEADALAAGGWPAGYVSVAQDLNMLEGVSGSTSAAASRATIAVIIYQAINAPFYNEQD